MIELSGRSYRHCDGMSRRGFLKIGSIGALGLSLPQMLQSQAIAKAAGRAAGARGAGAKGAKEKSAILIWLDGGPPQHETYDPKPQAPSEYRGALQAISTAIPGVQLSELLPRHAQLMDKMSLIRSMRHSNGDHFAAAHWMLTGYLGSNASNLPPQYPSIASIVSKIQGAKRNGMPAYVGLPNLHSVGLAPGYHGAAYLGAACNPFNANGDPNTDAYQVPNLNLPGDVTVDRMGERKGLLNAFDHARNEIDRSGLMDGLDRFSQEAFSMVTGPAAREAFSLNQEDPKLRDRYGRHTWGQSALLARRLVEAGVRFVTLTYSGWDWHSDIENGMKRLLPIIDAAIAGLIEDLDLRGMLDSTMVIVMGEFGRTPRINATAGRDHWGDVLSVLIAGGGVPPGVIVGSSNARGEVPKDRPVTPADLATTIYHQFGIDPATVFQNRSGRPIPIDGGGHPILELC